MVSAPAKQRRRSRMPVDALGAAGEMGRMISKMQTIEGKMVEASKAQWARASGAWYSGEASRSSTAMGRTGERRTAGIN